MKEREVCEYKLTDDYYIIGWKLHRLSTRPDLSEIPLPTEEMNNGFRDINGKPRFRLIKNECVLHEQEPTEHENALLQFYRTALPRVIKSLVSEIDSLRRVAGGESTPRYSALKDVIDKIQNGGN
jgi:hypothetical protein